ncbi:MAG: GC-type dockerin domain-anchored protein [Phycisphaerales bacterium]
MRITTRTAAMLAVAAGMLAGPAAMAQSGCPADIDGDGELTVFDFLAFQNLFDAGDLRADFDGNGRLDIFDFLEFQNLFTLGCSDDFQIVQLASVALDQFPHADYVRAFNAGQVISVAIDPSRATVPGGTVDVYLVEDKDASEWTSDPMLIDARGLAQPATFGGGASTADNIAMMGGTAFLNADAGESIGVPYDVVIDVNRNGMLDGGDLIDGYDDVGFWLFKDLTTLGPAAFTRVETYTATFPGIPSSRNQQRLTYPSDIASRSDVPVVIISHGNGQDYRWYDYMHDHFASHGWVVMSHQNDTVPGIETASTTTLTHTDYFFGNLDTIAGGALDGRLDQSRTVWIGHSRGGEGVARAYDRIVTGSYSPVNYVLEDILVVSSIAPTDFGIRARPGNSNFHLIYGSSDGDVRGSVASGSKPFAIYERGTGNKQVTYIQGADHNDFNCCGFNDFVGPAGTEIGRPEVQRVALIDWLALIQLYVRGNEPARDVNERQWESLDFPAINDSTVVDNEYRPARGGSDSVVDDFQSQGSTTLASSGASISFDVFGVFEGLMRDLDSTYTWNPSQPMNGMSRNRPSSIDSSNGVTFGWDGVPASFAYTLLPIHRDVSDFASLSFRACQISRAPETAAALEDLTFTVTLVDGSGGRSSINIGAYGGGIEEVYQRTGSPTGSDGWSNEFETITIRLADFLRDGTDIDLSDVEQVRFEFGPGFGSTEGRIGLDDVEFRVE